MRKNNTKPSENDPAKKYKYIAEILTLMAFILSAILTALFFALAYKFMQVLPTAFIR